MLVPHSCCDRITRALSVFSPIRIASHSEVVPLIDREKEEAPPQKITAVFQQVYGRIRLHLVNCGMKANMDALGAQLETHVAHAVDNPDRYRGRCFRVFAPVRYYLEMSENQKQIDLVVEVSKLGNGVLISAFKALKFELPVEINEEQIRQLSYEPVVTKLRLSSLRQNAILLREIRLEDAAIKKGIDKHREWLKDLEGIEGVQIASLPVEFNVDVEQAPPPIPAPASRKDLRELLATPVPTVNPRKIKVSRPEDAFAPDIFGESPKKQPVKKLPKIEEESEAVAAASAAPRAGSSVAGALTGSEAALKQLSRGYVQKRYCSSLTRAYLNADLKNANEVLVEDGSNQARTFRLGVKDFLDVAHDVLFTLGKAYEKGFHVHQDTHAENILIHVDADGKVHGVLSDFDRAAYVSKINPASGLSPSDYEKVRAAHWDECSHHGWLTPMSDTFGVVTCLGSSLIRVKFLQNRDLYLVRQKDIYRREAMIRHAQAVLKSMSINFDVRRELTERPYGLADVIPELMEKNPALSEEQKIKLRRLPLELEIVEEVYDLVSDTWQQSKDAYKHLKDNVALQTMITQGNDEQKRKAVNELEDKFISNAKILAKIDAMRKRFEALDQDVDPSGKNSCSVQ